MNCPPVQQDLTAVYGLVLALIAFAAGKLLSDREHRNRPPPGA